MQAAGLSLLASPGVGRPRHSSRCRLVARSSQSDHEHDAPHVEKGAWKGALLGALATPILAVMPAAQALEATALPPVAPEATSYPASVRQLLKELRSQSDAMQRRTWELEATQKLLYKSQEQLLAKQQQLADMRDEMRESQPQLFGFIAAGTVAMAGAFTGLRAYASSRLKQIDLEKRRAESGVEVEVKSRLIGEVEAEIRQRVAEQRAKEAANIVRIIEVERQARQEAEKRADALHARTCELQDCLDDVSASLAAVREAKQEAETQMALALIEVDAKARAADEGKKTQGEAAQAQREDFLSLMQQLTVERSRSEQLQQRLEEALASSAKAADRTSAAAGGLGELGAENARAVDLAAQLQELKAQQQVEAAQHQAAMEQLEAERGRSTSLLAQLGEVQAVARRQLSTPPAGDMEAAASGELREVNAKYLDALDQLQQERSRVTDLQHQLAAKQAELARIADDVARLRERSIAELARLRSGLEASGFSSGPPEDVVPKGVGSLTPQARAAASLAFEHQQPLQQLMLQHEINGSGPVNASSRVEGNKPVNGSSRVQGNTPVNGSGPGNGSSPVNGTGPPDGSVPAKRAPFWWELAGRAKQAMQGEPEAEQQLPGWAAGGLPIRTDSEPSLGGRLVLGGEERRHQQQQQEERLAAEQQPALWEQQGQQQNGQQEAERPAWVQQHAAGEAATDAAIPEPSALVQEWNDAQFTAEVLNLFPDKAVAEVEEARCLVERGGYTLLDVRPALELDVVGRVRGCVNIPVEDAQWVYNAVSQAKEVQRSANAEFMEQVLRRFPDLETPLVVGCSDGRAYAIEALEALEEAGYTRLVGLKGGFRAWLAVFDSKGRRRRSGQGGKGQLAKV